MSSPEESSRAFDNILLNALPREEYGRLSHNMESVSLAPGEILYHEGDTTRHAYFPKGGVISLLSATESGRTIEVGIIGREGTTGIPIILGSSVAHYQVVAQLAGQAWRVKGSILAEEFKRGGKLQDLLLRYTQALLVQIAQLAACNSLHTVEERLCRWMLVSSYRTQSDTLQITHEFLSHMLGVPRTSVTMIAGSLQKEGLIKYSRGKITILDSRLLAAASCECYRRIREGINNLLFL